MTYPNKSSQEGFCFMSHTTTHAKAKKDIKKDRLLVYLNSMWFQTNTPPKNKYIILYSNVFKNFDAKPQINKKIYIIKIYI